MSTFSFSVNAAVPATPACSPESAFLDAMRSAGLDYSGPIIADGALHRFKVNGDRHYNSFYCLHLDGIAAGHFGCWKRGIQENWCAVGRESLTPEQRAENERRWQAHQAERDADRRRQQNTAATAAQAILDAARPATGDHPYLAKKGVPASPGVMLGAWPQRQKEHCLLIPLRTADGLLATVQAIFPEKGADGRDKDFLKGGAKKGAFFAMGDLHSADTILIAEGYATAATLHQATGHPAVMAIDAGNLKPVAEILAKLHPRKRFIIAADNDRKEDGSNPGVNAATAAAKTIKAALAVPAFADDEAGTDFNDLATLHGLDAVRAAIAEAERAESDSAQPDADSPDSPDPAKPRFIWVQDFCALPAAEVWIVQGYLERDVIGVIYGDSEAFKSFIAIDLCAHVATGRPWRGFRVQQGVTAFIAGEGGNGLRKRFKAWFQHHHEPLRNIAISTVPLALCDPANVQALVADTVAFLGAIKPSLIVLDTLNAHFGGGDENSTKDMSLFLAGMRALRAATGATVLALHHCGHGAKDRGRGSISLRNGIDWEYRAERQPESLTTTLTCTKAKDSDRPKPLAWELETVALPWLDSEGTSLSSAILQPLDAVPVKEEPLSSQQRQALDVLKGLYQTAQDNLASSGHDPAGARVTIGDWQEAMKPVIFNKTSRYRIREVLLDKGAVRIEGAFVYPASL